MLSLVGFLNFCSVDQCKYWVNLIWPGHLSWCTRWRGTRRAWAGPLWAAPRGCCPAWGWTWSWGSRGCRGRAAAPSACCPAGAAPAADPAHQSPEHGELETRWDKELSKLYLSDVWSYAFSGDSWWWTRVPFSGGENPLKILSTKTKKDTMPFSMYCISM